MAKRLGIRRWGDRCFHEVEEVLEDGYIVEGIFIRSDEVVDTRTWDDGEQSECDPDAPSDRKKKTIRH